MPSMVLSTDGGIPVDYEEGELEDEGTSSSQPSDSKPAAGTRRVRQDEPDASSSKRPRSVRDAVPSTLEALAIVSDPSAITPDPPVIPSEQARYGRTISRNVIPWYVVSRIVDDAEAASKNFDPMTHQMRTY
ncbi:LOW QUALITY PROTEIN: hypothetical protein PHMEG_00020847 [Phytophthora megakarya]|uniref:Uncharacterized protein n=1 Tax=Phytophthora megakarya TaxID=4795 RepID=A0A225VPM7_9STRA|nr:LOW QUALITY PROTEIN: hypothetical protein PHMEG_00020847 [Phytophthora megakarya]